MYPIDLTGRNAVIFGVANDRSIAWAIARTLAESGARIALTYQNDRLKDRVARLADTLDNAVILPCDASEDGQIQEVFESLQAQMGSLSVLVHSIAFANREDLSGRLADTGRDGFRLALEISAFTLLPMVKARGAADDGRRQRNRHDVPRIEPRVSGLQRNGHREGRAGARGEAVGARVRRRRYPGERHLRRPHRYAGGPGNQRVPGHEAYSRGARAVAAEHHGGRSGENGAIPVQRLIDGRYRNGIAGGRRLPHHGGVRGTIHPHPSPLPSRERE